MIDWTLVIEIALFALVAMVVSVLVPWLKAKIGAEQVAHLWKWVCMAVQAAEQMFGNDRGEQKKAFVEEFLAARGYDVDEGINVLIEAAVRELTD